MKVLLVDVSSRLGGVGGAQRVAANLFRELPKRGIETFYMGYRTEYLKNARNALFLRESRQKGLKSGIEGHGLNRLVDSRLMRVAYYSSYSAIGINTAEMREYVERVRPDIVLASSIQDYIVLKALRRHLGSAKLLYIEHANASGAYKGSLDYNIIHLTFGTGVFMPIRRAQRRFFRFFDGVIALNAQQYRSVRVFNRNVTVIHSSSLMDSTTVNARRLEALRSKLGIRKSDNVVLYLGRLVEAQKNVGTLIRAFTGMKGDKLRLLIVGDGRSRPEYEAMAAHDSRIRLTGRVPERTLAYYYSLADLYVLPSVWESFNATFIEAATMGLPLLLSRKAINEDIERLFGKRLYTFEPSDVADLKAKIERFFSNWELRRRLIALSGRIADEYSREKQMDAYAAALKKFNSTGSF